MSTLLLFLAIAPPVGFLLFVNYMDRHEPEPWSYILYILFLGALSCIPAALFELAIGSLPLFAIGGLPGAVLVSFIQVAPVEEAVKLLVVMKFVWKNPNFNEENDGIVYTGTAAIGFALAENILYVAQHGFATGIARALTAIPLHTFTGVIMGYYLGIARFETDTARVRAHIWKGFLYAYVIHAIYDTFALSGTVLALLLLPVILTVIFAGVRYLKKGRQLSLSRWIRPLRGTTSAVSDAATQEAPTQTVQALQSATVNTRKTEKLEKAGLSPAGKWKIVISRTLLTISAMFWALLISAYFSEDSKSSLTMFELIAGGTVFTFIPVAIGFLLELSYRRSKKGAIPAS